VRGPGRDRDPAAGIAAEEGITHWSSRRLADWLGRSRKIPVSHDFITWRRLCLQPRRSEGFRFSAGPGLDARVRDVAELYLNPLGNAVVVCVDEKSPCQALERTQPIPAAAPVHPRTAGPRPFAWTKDANEILASINSAED
jgi:hypothetical protein